MKLLRNGESQSRSERDAGSLQKRQADRLHSTRSSLGPRRMDGSRSDARRSGIGLDDSEWDEPERLSSTPLPSPGGSTIGYGSSNRGGRAGGSGSMKSPLTVATASPTPASSFRGPGSTGNVEKWDDVREGDDGGWDRPSPSPSAWDRSSPAPSMLSAREGR